ncbi:hypothetical protein [Gordonia sp. NPDC003585]|uniref:nucleotidyltransferase domain-containing protein n=1 Tax=Gordonia sp. NPDC003585 TaxID=3154275 RepID=UPI0033B5CD34
MSPAKGSEEAAFRSRYGPWANVTPGDVSDLLGDFDRPWWVAGGWAIDAFTGTERDHEDLDLCVFRTDLDALLAALDDRLHAWATGLQGSLWPVTGEYPLPGDSTQLWLRADATSPWLLDVLLTPDDDGRWVHRRDGSSAPLDEVTWRSGEIRYLDPEIVLMYKAKANRSKDLSDLRRAIPQLDDHARKRLREFLIHSHPGHAWIGLLDSAS